MNNQEYINGVNFVVEQCQDTHYLKTHFGKVFGIIHWPEVFAGIQSAVMCSNANHSEDFCDGVTAICEALNDQKFIKREYGTGSFGEPDYSRIFKFISGRTILEDYNIWTGRVA